MASARNSRRWPQFSLRTFLLLSVLVGVGSAWIAYASKQYQTEQLWVSELARTVPPGTLMTVATNDNSCVLAGHVLM
jgi:hypothetical protein